MSYSKLRLSKRNRVYSNCRAGVIYLKLRLINVGTRRAVSAVRAQAIYLNGVPCPPPHPKLTKKALSPLQGGRVECSASGAERRGSFYIQRPSHDGGQRQFIAEGYVFTEKSNLRLALRASYSRIKIHHHQYKNTLKGLNFKA